MRSPTPTPSRRTLLSWIGMLVPVVGSTAALGTTGPASLPASLMDSFDAKQREAVLGLGAWLRRQGIDAAALDRVDSGRGGVTQDIRASFETDELVSVDGFLLPTGFCRYCLAMHARAMLA